METDRPETAAKKGTKDRTSVKSAWHLFLAKYRKQEVKTWQRKRKPAVR